MLPTQLPHHRYKHRLILPCAAFYIARKGIFFSTWLSVGVHHALTLS